MSFVCDWCSKVLKCKRNLTFHVNVCSKKQEWEQEKKIVKTTGENNALIVENKRQEQIILELVEHNKALVEQNKIYRLDTEKKISDLIEKMRILDLENKNNAMIVELKQKEQIIFELVEQSRVYRIEMEKKTLDLEERNKFLELELKTANKKLLGMSKRMQKMEEHNKAIQERLGF